MAGAAVITLTQAQEAVAIAGSLEGWRKARDEANQICQAKAFGPNGSGISIGLSEEMAAIIRAHRIAEIDRAIAKLRRRAAQIDLSMEIEL